MDGLWAPMDAGFIYCGILDSGGGGGEECAAGGHEKLVSDCFAVSANDKEVFNNSALNSFTVTYWPIKVFSFWHC